MHGLGRGVNERGVRDLRGSEGGGENLKSWNESDERSKDEQGRRVLSRQEPENRAEGAGREAKWEEQTFSERNRI